MPASRPEPWWPRAERGSSLIQAAGLGEKQQHKQSRQPTQTGGPEETGWARTGDLPWTHTHTHRHERKAHEGRYYNYADDIHLMMTFSQNTDMGNYTLKHAKQLSRASSRRSHRQSHMKAHRKCFHSYRILPPPLPLAASPSISFISSHRFSIRGQIDAIMTAVCFSSTPPPFFFSARLFKSRG